MFEAVYEFLGLVGVDLAVPETLSEFFPWFIVCMVGVCVIWFVLSMFRYFVATIFSGGRKF